MRVGGLRGLLGTKMLASTILISASDTGRCSLAVEVLLASDPDAVTASSALSVHVGFYSDPEDSACRKGPNTRNRNDSR